MGFIAAWATHRHARALSAGVLLGLLALVPAVPALADSPETPPDPAAVTTVETADSGGSEGVAPAPVASGGDVPSAEATAGAASVEPAAAPAPAPPAAPAPHPTTDLVAAAATGTSGTATGSSETGSSTTSPSTTSPSTTTTTPVPLPGALSLSGKINVSGRSTSSLIYAGGSLLAVWTVKNTGASAVTGVTVRALNRDASCDVATLQPGSTTTCRTTALVLTQRMIDSGSVSIAGTARGVSRGSAVSSSQALLTKVVPAAAKLTVAQRHQLLPDVNGDGKAGARDGLVFTYTVSSTGNVTVKGVGIGSSLLSAHGIRATCRVTTLAPGGSTTCTAPGLVVRDSEAARAQLLSDPRAAGTSPSGKPVSSPASLVRLSLAPSPSKAAGKPGKGSAASPTTRTPRAKAQARAPQPQLKPGLALAMRVASVVDNFDHNGISDVGDGIVYHYVVANVGQLSLSGVTLSDRLAVKAGGTIACPATTLQPGASMTCKATRPYVVTRSDFHAGELSNRATARAVVDRSGRSIGAAATLSRPLAVPLAQTVGPVIVASTLPFTGTSPAGLVYTGSALFVAGLGLMLVRRRLEA